MKIFHNDNGKAYYILEGDIGGPALLARVKKEVGNPCDFIVCSTLERTSWHNGNYFVELEEAFDFYKEKAMHGA